MQRIIKMSCGYEARNIIMSDNKAHMTKMTTLQQKLDSETHSGAKMHKEVREIRCGSACLSTTRTRTAFVAIFDSVFW